MLIYQNIAIVTLPNVKLLQQCDPCVRLPLTTVGHTDTYTEQCYAATFRLSLSSPLLLHTISLYRISKCSSAINQLSSTIPPWEKYCIIYTHQCSSSQFKSAVLQHLGFCLFFFFTNCFDYIAIFSPCSEFFCCLQYHFIKNLTSVRPTMNRIKTF